MREEPTIDEAVIHAWQDDLRSIENGEVVKVMSGELNCDLYRAIKDHIRRIVADHGTKFRIIGGPIVCLDHETCSNAALELCEEGLVDLWISPYRQTSHFRIFGSRFVYRENYHEALAERRTGYYIRDLLAVSKYSYDFDNTIDSLGLQKYSRQCPHLMTAYKDEIIGMKEKLGELYDFLLADELRSRLQEFREQRQRG